MAYVLRPFSDPGQSDHFRVVTPCGDNLWLCTEDNGIDGELNDAVWIVGRHSPDCGFVQVCEPLPFSSALELVERLPTPVRGGEHLQITYETVADFHAGRESC